MNENRSTFMRLVMIGAGGHARVLHALAEAAGHQIIGICDPALVRSGKTVWRGSHVLGGDEALEKLNPSDVAVVNGIGHLVGAQHRQLVFERIKQRGYYFPPLVHPVAWVADSVKLAEGVQVMAGAIIQPDSCIGMNTIVNTKASIDHDCHIGAHVHIAPGATLCGGVSVGEGAFIGAGATLVQKIKVGKQAVVGAGTTLLKTLMDREKFSDRHDRFVENLASGPNNL